MHIRHLLLRVNIPVNGKDLLYCNWHKINILVLNIYFPCLCACVSPSACIWMCSPSSICICKPSSLIALLMQPVVVVCHRDLALSCPKLDCLTSPLPKYIQQAHTSHIRSLWPLGPESISCVGLRICSTATPSVFLLFFFSSFSRHKYLWILFSREITPVLKQIQLFFLCDTWAFLFTSKRGKTNSICLHTSVGK